MTLNEYQRHALETAIYPAESRIVYPTLGLTGEAGEVADKVKKVIRDGHREFTPEKKAEIMKEIGDVLWYCATLSHWKKWRRPMSTNSARAWNATASRAAATTDRRFHN